MSESTLSKQRFSIADWGRGGRIRRLASPRLTILGLVLLGAGGYTASQQLDDSPWLVISALSLLSVNLVAALISNPMFRVRPALFAMHVGLLLLVLSLAFGHLTRFRGHFEISEGERFNPARMIADRVGLVAPVLPAEGVFIQKAVSINYAPGLMRRETQSQIQRADGSITQATDGHPLMIDGYRFYVTHNKGFSALVTWRKQAGAPGVTGTLHFPSFPRLAPTQSLDWTAPDGTRLNFAIQPRRHPQDDNWSLNRDMAGEWMTLSHEGITVQIRPGERAQLPSGAVLSLEGIHMWIGYRVFYDPSLSWCFAAAVMTLCGLGMHLLGRRRAGGRSAVTTKKSPGVMT